LVVPRHGIFHKPKDKIRKVFLKYILILYKQIALKFYTRFTFIKKL
jgi:hypothetical protein